MGRKITSKATADVTAAGQPPASSPLVPLRSEDDTSRLDAASGPDGSAASVGRAAGDGDVDTGGVGPLDSGDLVAFSSSSPPRPPSSPECPLPLPSVRSDLDPLLMSDAAARDHDVDGRAGEVTKRKRAQRDEEALGGKKRLRKQRKVTDKEAEAKHSADAICRVSDEKDVDMEEASVAAQAGGETKGVFESSLMDMSRRSSVEEIVLYDDGDDVIADLLAESNDIEKASSSGREVPHEVAKLAMVPPCTPAGVPRASSLAMEAPTTAASVRVAIPQAPPYEAVHFPLEEVAQHEDKHPTLNHSPISSVRPLGANIQRAAGPIPPSGSRQLAPVSAT